MATVCKNRSESEVMVLEIGTRDSPDPIDYTDIDVRWPGDGRSFYTHKDDTPYPVTGRRSA